MTTPWTLAGLTGLLITAASPASFGQSQVVGVPTYVADTHQDIALGGQAPVNLVAYSSGYKSAGSQGTIAVLSWPTPQMPPSTAYAASSDTTLKAQAVASANLGYDRPALPYAHVTAVAENTRFWQFTAAQSLSFISIMDGSLSALITPIEVLGGQNFASVHYTLDLLDSQGNQMLSVFDLRAQVRAVDWARTMRFTQSASGYADPALWAAAFTRTDDGGDYFGITMAYDIVHTDVITLPAAWDVAAGDVRGIRWRLETDSEIEGLLGGATMAADLGHTVQIGFVGGDAAVIARGATELLAVSPVPEPASWLMVLGGLALLLPRRRRP